MAQSKHHSPSGVNWVSWGRDPNQPSGRVQNSGARVKKKASVRKMEPLLPDKHTTGAGWCSPDSGEIQM